MPLKYYTPKSFVQLALAYDDGNGGEMWVAEAKNMGADALKKKNIAGGDV